MKNYLMNQKQRILKKIIYHKQHSAAFFVIKKKKKNPYYNEEIRQYIVSNLSCVDEVILRDYFEFKQVILDNNVDIFVASEEKNPRFNNLKEYYELVYLERCNEISTTKIKNDIKKCIKVIKFI